MNGQEENEELAQDVAYLIVIIRGLIKAMFILEAKVREELAWLKNRNSVITNRVMRLERDIMELNAEVHKLKGERTNPHIEDTP